MIKKFFNFIKENGSCIVLGLVVVIGVSLFHTFVYITFKAVLEFCSFTLTTNTDTVKGVIQNDNE